MTAVMRVDEAVAFLSDHQPMPPDGELTQELADRYHRALDAVMHCPDVRVPSLLLNSFGDGDGFGVYQLADATLRTLPRDAVIDALSTSLRSERRSVRAWSMEMALEYLDPRLIGPAVDLLTDGNSDERAFAAYYLASFDQHDALVTDAMSRVARSERDGEIRAVLGEWIRLHAPESDGLTEVR